MTTRRTTFTVTCDAVLLTVVITAGIYSTYTRHWAGAAICAAVAALMAHSIGRYLAHMARQRKRAAPPRHLHAAADDSAWEQHQAQAHDERPTSVVIGGRTYAVQPLTLPVLKALMQAGEAVMAVQQQHPMQFLLGGEQHLSADQLAAAYDGMYAQLAVLLVDAETGENVSVDTLGMYVPLPRLTALLQLLGPGA